MRDAQTQARLAWLGLNRVPESDTKDISQKTLPKLRLQHVLKSMKREIKGDLELEKVYIEGLEIGLSLVFKPEEIREVGYTPCNIDCDGDLNKRLNYIFSTIEPNFHIIKGIIIGLLLSMSFDEVKLLIKKIKLTPPFNKIVEDVISGL